MYRLMISFEKDEFKNCTWVKPKEYVLSDELEVCRVITSLSHLNPIITLFKLPLCTADDVLKDFEFKDI